MSESETPTLTIVPARPDHHRQTWDIFSKVVTKGDTYVFPPNSSESDFDQHWWAYHPWSALDKTRVAGTYIMKPNQLGLGAHIANAAFMVHPSLQGKGVGQKMAEHAIREAKKADYKGIQFNCVVSTNRRALNLWQKLGFNIIGTIPHAFNHADQGLVDAHILFKSLE